MATDGLTARFGGRTVQENIDRAIASGDVKVMDDGRWTVPAPMGKWYLPVKYVLPLDCTFLNHFLFKYGYNKTAVPVGCRMCFKVKVVPANFRSLIALRSILEELPYHSKCGIDFFNIHSRDFYAGYLYFDSLVAARVGWKIVRERVDNHPHLGTTTAVTIKRGCSNYEAYCGPSDRWTFRDELEEIEAELKPRFHIPVAPPANYSLLRATKMVQWLQIAYNLKDDTYLEFTAGKPLHPPTYCYPPDASNA